MKNFSTAAGDRMMDHLCQEYQQNNYIDPKVSQELGVKRGLRNADGTGVLAGLTNVSDVVGYEMVDGKKTPAPGKLIYRGIDVQQLIDGAAKEDRFIFEEVIWLLLIGTLPSKEELADFRDLMENYRDLPDGFVEDILMKKPSPNIMNMLARGVLSLYSYDDDPEDIDLPQTIRRAILLISSLPTIMVNAYQIKRRVFDKKSMFLHRSVSGQSVAEHILTTSRSDRSFTKEEARLLDLCLTVHADHGGGNNSTFTCRVLSSSATDAYSAISAAIGSLKGRKHGGANHKVMEMLDDLMQAVGDFDDDEEIAAYLRRVRAKQAGDGSGLIYGLGHAVYTISDPRAVILRESVRPLAGAKGYGDQFKVLQAIERLGPSVLSDSTGGKDICANVDLYSGLTYRMLGITPELFTPLFAISRIPGWCAHRTEEIIFANRIIRPAYKYLDQPRQYVPLAER